MSIQAQEPADDDESEATRVRSIDSEELLNGKNQLIIRHAGEDYRLILTRNNRLILQK